MNPFPHKAMSEWTNVASKRSKEIAIRFVREAKV